jgi:BlaI family penicillinase repressor
MKKSKPGKPTDAELTILKVLWRCGASTVREVWEQISPDKRTGYTTVLKLLQIMIQIGLVQRNETARSHVYEATVTEDQTQRQAVGHLLERVFSGSARKLVLQALSIKRASPAELEEIRQLLDDMEKERE